MKTTTKKATPKPAPKTIQKAAPKKETKPDAKKETAPKEKVLAASGKVQVVRAVAPAPEPKPIKVEAEVKKAKKETTLVVKIDRKAQTVSVEKKEPKAAKKKAGKVLGTSNEELTGSIKTYCKEAKAEAKAPSFWRCVHRLRDDLDLSFSHARLRKLWDALGLAA